MQARLIAYPPDAAAVSRWLRPGERLRIGRDPDCSLVLDHPSVSRAHAELYFDDGRWRLRDLGSKNGSFADGAPVTDHPLPEQCWLRLGDCFLDFGCFEAAQAAALQRRHSERRALSQVLTRQVERAGDDDSLPARFLSGAVELAGCCRGFLLLVDPRIGDFTVQASLHLEPDEIGSSGFSGSVGAVQRALSTGKPLVVNDVGNEAWLASRGSVIAGGITTLLCLPLSDGRQVFGAVYADRRRNAAEPHREPITDFDLELLSAFAENATLYLLAQRAIRSIETGPRWRTIVGNHTEEAVPGATR